MHQRGASQRGKQRDSHIEAGMRVDHQQWRDLLGPALPSEVDRNQRGIEPDHCDGGVNIMLAFDSNRQHHQHCRGTGNQEW